MVRGELSIQLMPLQSAKPQILQAEDPLRIAAHDFAHRSRIESVNGSHMTDRIVVGHVERIIGPHDDVVGAKGLDQRL